MTVSVQDQFCDYLRPQDFFRVFRVFRGSPSRYSGAVIHQEQSLKPRSSRWPWIFALLIAVTGTSISFLLWNARAVMESNAVEEEFQLEARNFHGMVAQEIQLFMDVLDSIRQLHSISDQITSKDFEEFVGKGMSFQMRVLQGFGFGLMPFFDKIKLLAGGKKILDGPDQVRDLPHRPNIGDCQAQDPEGANSR